MSWTYKPHEATFHRLLPPWRKATMKLSPGPSRIAPVFAIALIGSTLAFVFTAPEKAFACDNYTVSWTGGVAPFHIVFMPLLQGGTNRSIGDPTPDANGVRSFTAQLINAAPSEDNKSLSAIVVGMGDATGSFTGGSVLSELYASQTNTVCDTSDITNWSFDVDTRVDIPQCGISTFGLDQATNWPLYVYPMVPSGTTQTLVVNRCDLDAKLNWRWRNNVSVGENIVFAVVDSRGRQGGVTGLTSLVTSSGDTSCLVAGGVPVLPSPPACTPGTTSSSRISSSTSSSIPTGSSALSSGGIAGIAVGAVAAVSIILLLVLLLCRARSRNRGAVDLDDRTNETHGQQNQITPHGGTLMPYVISETASSFTQPTRSRQWSGSSAPLIYSTSSRQMSMASSDYSFNERPLTMNEFRVGAIPEELPPQYEDFRLRELTMMTSLPALYQPSVYNAPNAVASGSGTTAKAMSLPLEKHTPLDLTEDEFNPY